MKKTFKRLFSIILCINLILANNNFVFAASNNEDAMASLYVGAITSGIGNNSNDAIVNGKFSQYSDVLNKFQSTGLVGGDNYESYKTILNNNKSRLLNAINNQDVTELTAISHNFHWGIAIKSLVDIYNKMVFYSELHKQCSVKDGGFKIFACKTPTLNSNIVQIYDDSQLGGISAMTYLKNLDPTITQLDKILQTYISSVSSNNNGILSRIFSFFSGNNNNNPQLYKVTNNTNKPGIYTRNKITMKKKSSNNHYTKDIANVSEDEVLKAAWKSTDNDGESPQTFNITTGSQEYNPNGPIFTFLQNCQTAGYMGYVNLTWSTNTYMVRNEDGTETPHATATIDVNYVVTDCYTWDFNNPPLSPSWAVDYFVSEGSATGIDFSNDFTGGYPTLTNQDSQNGNVNNEINASRYEFYYEDVNKSLTEAIQLLSNYKQLDQNSTKAKELGYSLISGAFFEPGDDKLETGDIFKDTRITNLVSSITGPQEFIENASKGISYNGDYNNNLGSDIIFMCGNLPVLAMCIKEPNPDATTTLQQSIQKRKQMGEMVINYITTTKKEGTTTLDYSPKIVAMNNFDGKQFDTIETGLIYDLYNNEIRMEDDSQNNISSGNYESLKNYIGEGNFWVAPKGQILLTKYFPMYKSETTQNWMPLGRACLLNTDNLTFNSANGIYTVSDGGAPLFYMCDPVTNERQEQNLAEKIYCNEICDIDGNIGQNLSQVTQQGSPDPQATFDGQEDEIRALVTN